MVAPATYNTINKWAAGIADNYVLNQLAELTGLGAHIVVLPFISQGLPKRRRLSRVVIARGDSVGCGCWSTPPGTPAPGHW